ncbi:MAG: hypothetical protein ACHREM_13605 [Polyangiales bacterium]
MITLKQVADNSFGRGYYPLPSKLKYLDRFSDCFRTENILDHKVLVSEDCHVLTVPSRKVSLMHPDILSLLKQGLMRIQGNDPNQLSFYFYVGVRPR